MQKSTTGRAFSPMAAQAAPNMKQNTTIWSTSPRAIASMMLVGNVCSASLRAALVAGVARSGHGLSGKLHADAGLDQIHRAKSDEQRDGGDDFEIENRLAADAAHGLDAAGSGDAVRPASRTSAAR